MTYEQYWEASCYLVNDYYKAHKIGIEKRNQELWLQGLYIYQAMSVVMSNSFDKHSKLKYPDKPFDVFAKTEEELEREREEEQRKAIASFKRLQSSMNRKFGGDTKCQ